MPHKKINNKWWSLCCAKDAMRQEISWGSGIIRRSYPPIIRYLSAKSTPSSNKQPCIMTMGCFDKYQLPRQLKRPFTQILATLSFIFFYLYIHLNNTVLHIALWGMSPGERVSMWGQDSGLIFDPFTLQDTEQSDGHYTIFGNKCSNTRRSAPSVTSKSMPW